MALQVGFDLEDGKKLPVYGKILPVKAVNEARNSAEIYTIKAAEDKR